MKFTVHPKNPEFRKLKQLLEILEDDGVIIVPTDGVYALACDMANQKAVDKICKLRGLDPVKANLTFMCEDIARIASCTSPISNEHFRLIKRNTPGPFTFILKSNNQVPKLFKNKKRTIGARVPNHIFLQELIGHLGRPLMTATLKEAADEFTIADIDEIINRWEKRVDAIVESGTVPNEETTVVDLTGDEVLILREGAVELEV